MSIIDELTIDDFKKEFRRNFPYLPVWDSTKVYFIDNKVYVEPNFYKSLVDNNTQPVTDATSWQTYQDDVDNYVSDEDIEKAWAEAKASFNIRLLGNDETSKLVFLYLVAFYLAYDLFLAQSGAYGIVNYPATSVTVGSVSESYYVPKVYLENPILSFYTKNGFGLKFLNLVYPKLIGNVDIIFGWTLP